MTSPATTGPQGVEPGGRFAPDALEANRAGRLTEAQRLDLRGIRGAWRQTWLMLAVGSVVVAVVVMTSSRASVEAAFRPLVAVACLAVAAVALFRALPMQDPLARDLADGRLRVVEGAMETRVDRGWGTTAAATTYFLDIGDLHLRIPRFEYEALPRAGMARVWYLPRSRRAVNLERLPDAPLPAGVLDSPAAAVRTVLGGLVGAASGVVRTPDRAHHEAMAQLQAVTDALRPAAVPAGGLPPGDGRPLGEALVGAWRSTFVSVSFDPDGTFRASLPGGREESGRWSVDGTGRLQAEAAEGSLSGEASVAGDALTLALDGPAITLRRVGPGAAGPLGRVP